VNNDNSKQEQVGTQILCFSGGKFEQKVQHMLKALFVEGITTTNALTLHVNKQMHKLHLSATRIVHTIENVKH
jgi:hypothetical protein